LGVKSVIELSESWVGWTPSNSCLNPSSLLSKITLRSG